MIKFNLRYRGPYEYDKYILTAAQLFNEVKRLTKSISKNAKELYGNDDLGINKMYEELTKEDGVSTKILNKYYELE